MGSAGAVKRGLTRRFQRYVIRFYPLKTRNNRSEKPERRFYIGTEGVAEFRSSKVEAWITRQYCSPIRHINFRIKLCHGLIMFLSLIKPKSRDHM